MRRMFEPLEPLSFIFQSFCVKYVKIYIKFPSIWCTLLFCSLIINRVTWENEKNLNFPFFPNCWKKCKKLPSCNILVWRPLKPQSSSFGNLFMKCLKLSFIWCIFLICSFIFLELQGKIWDIIHFNISTFLKNSIMYCNTNVLWF